MTSLGFTGAGIGTGTAIPEPPCTIMPPFTITPRWKKTFEAGTIVPPGRSVAASAAAANVRAVPPPRTPVQMRQAGREVP
jgi:hypothetical protein